MRTSKPVGGSDVLRHALLPPEAALDEMLRERIRTALEDDRPSLPAADVFKRLRARHADSVGKPES